MLQGIVNFSGILDWKKFSRSDTKAPKTEYEDW